MSNDYQNSVMRCIDMVLQCRPDDPYDFVATFFIDEQSTQSKLSHALHSLYYHDKHPLLFRNISCLIFCLDNTEALYQQNYDLPSSAGSLFGGTMTSPGNPFLDTELMSLHNLKKIISHLYGTQRQPLVVIINDILITSPSPSGSSSSISPATNINPSTLSFTFPEFEYILLSVILSIKFYDHLIKIIDEFSTTDYQLNHKSIDEFLAYFKMIRPSPFHELYDPFTSSGSSPSIRNHYDSCVIKGVEIFKQNYVATSLWNRIYVGNCVQIFLQDRHNQMKNALQGKNN